MIYLSNAFSLSMVGDGNVSIREIPVDLVSENLTWNGFTSVVGHQSTADLFSAILGRRIETNRVSISLNPGDHLIVGQYSGPRLEEGATELPSGASITWRLVQPLRDGEC